MRKVGKEVVTVSCITSTRLHSNYVSVMFIKDKTVRVLIGNSRNLCIHRTYSSLFIKCQEVTHHTIYTSEVNLNDVTVRCIPCWGQLMILITFSLSTPLSLVSFVALLEKVLGAVTNNIISWITLHLQLSYIYTILNSLFMTYGCILILNYFFLLTPP